MIPLKKDSIKQWRRLYMYISNDPHLRECTFKENQENRI